MENQQIETRNKITLKIEKSRAFSIHNMNIGGDNNIFFILGPCSIESIDLLIECAEVLSSISKRNNIPIIFKASWDKANRTSIKSFRGLGLEKGLCALEHIKSKYNLPILTDVHEPVQVLDVARVADIIQIPALLSRQTDLIESSSKTNKIINIKKGQFMAPEDMKYAVEKATSSGASKIILTERGTSFGYHNLVVDFRSIYKMRENGFPIVFDATHSIQTPSSNLGVSGGDREYIPVLLRAAIGAGIDGIFMEVHPSPQNAKSDSQTMIKLDNLEALLKNLSLFHNLSKNFFDNLS